MKSSEAMILAVMNTIELENVDLISHNLLTDSGEFQGDHTLVVAKNREWRFLVLWSCKGKSVIGACCCMMFTTWVLRLK